MFPFSAIFLIYPLCALFALCPFCDPVVIERHRVAETERFLVLYSLTPATNGNLLLVPKRHITRFDELDLLEAAELFGLIQKTQEVFKQCYGLNDYFLLQKNGKNAGQSVDHVHIHAIPCPDNLELSRVFLERSQLTFDEIHHCIQELKPFF